MISLKQLDGSKQVPKSIELPSGEKIDVPLYLNNLGTELQWVEDDRLRQFDTCQELLSIKAAKVRACEVQCHVRGVLCRPKVRCGGSRILNTKVSLPRRS